MTQPDDEEQEPIERGSGDADDEAIPEVVPDGWLDPKPFDPAGR